MLVPFAGCPAAASGEALRGLVLPHLQRLLARLAPAGDDPGSAASLSTPHERALARAWGLSAQDGLVPLAAWDAQQVLGGADGDGWAWITPCHWQVATDHIRMEVPEALALDAAEAQALLAAMEPYCAEDGITLHYEGPLRWLARGEIFRALPTASLDRVSGRVLDDWMSRSEAARPLRRLQQEMQMLFYTLPLNEARVAGGLLPVNSFWASGTGALPPGAPAQRPAGLRSDFSLRAAALSEDWPAWQAAWRELDANAIARLLQDLDAGQPVRLTLCGEANARSWDSTGGPSLWRRLGSMFRPSSTAALLETL